MHQPQIKKIHLRQIIVQTPEIAQIVYQKLQNRQSFSDIACIYSIDLQNREKYKGDIGWFTLNELNEPIAQTVSSIKINEYTKNPIQTEYG